MLVIWLRNHSYFYKQILRSALLFVRPDYGCFSRQHHNIQSTSQNFKYGITFKL